MLNLVSLKLSVNFFVPLPLCTFVVKYSLIRSLVLYLRMVSLENEIYMVDQRGSALKNSCKLSSRVVS